MTSNTIHMMVTVSVILAYIYSHNSSPNLTRPRLKACFPSPHKTSIPSLLILMYNSSQFLKQKNCHINTSFSYLLYLLIPTDFLHSISYLIPTTSYTPTLVQIIIKSCSVTVIAS